MSIFQNVMVQRPKRSTFDLSHDVKLTCNFGQLVPFLCEEVVPGDTWKGKCTSLVRFAPLIAPVMHRINVTTHFFYVPFRIIWDDFENFITGGKDGNYKSDFPHLPMQFESHSTPPHEYADIHGLWKTGSLADYLNYPTAEANRTGGGSMVSALPFRAYQLIYDEYYRDENLIEEVDIDKGNGLIEQNTPEYIKLLTLRRRAYRKDYFTSALPWTQKGDTQPVPVDIKGGVAGSLHSDSRIGASVLRNLHGDYVGELEVGQQMQIADRNYAQMFNSSSSPQGSRLVVDNSANLDVSDLNVVAKGSMLIEDLRRASRIQRWLERQARSGNRYIEALAAHFGIISDDARLQRPEFLGGGITPVQIGDVLQTSSTDSTTPQANPAGTGFSLGGSNTFKRTFKERGYIMGIMSVCPEPAYSEGLPRAYRKFDKYDFYWPEFATLGEQEIYNYEVALRGLGSSTETFGYAPRYAEYKFIPNRVHGDFKTDLKFWNLNRHYSEQPTLSKEFIEVNDETQDLNRIFAVQDADTHHLWVQLRNDITARRPMPYLPDPSL